MSTYSVLVTSSPYDSSRSLDAVRFCQQLLETGQELGQVFFYQAGIYNAMGSMIPTNGEVNLFEAWTRISNESGAALRVCVTAGEKRGVTSQVCSSPFEQTGLAEFFTALHDSDKLVQF
ncbi:sulfurtransferase complex subunit TusD [Aestuariibacter sp. A3R04]|uniref:sulfurtransferase complex subunit TusD n=1 Tax=Aestuariibacter sp. A3R04 TaxID=2841571 RepID=UPI001C0931E1|nr:sulfurtransferase complex subunit TusD [Aestuariibacter sp. A3R04]MBU3022828.1 sulfurtransferase complex subunit TusD [Aestuariibacter sp. A3R04]